MFYGRQRISISIFVRCAGQNDTQQPSSSRRAQTVQRKDALVRYDSGSIWLCFGYDLHRREIQYEPEYPF
jgi:hypothetical protein